MKLRVLLTLVRLKCMKFILLYLLFDLMSPCAKAQDERYFRQVFSGELLEISKKDKNNTTNRKYNFVYTSPYYLLDINSDGQSESLAFVKKDNFDFFEIYDGKNNLIYSYLLENTGVESELYRIELKALNKHTNVILLHYFEGYTKYLNYQSVARIHAITIDRNDLKTLKGFKAAAIFDETKLLRGHYHKRNYKAYLEDINEDGTKELIVKYNNISSIYLYGKDNKWSEYKQKL